MNELTFNFISSEPHSHSNDSLATNCTFSGYACINLLDNDNFSFIIYVLCGIIFISYLVAQLLNYLEKKANNSRFPEINLHILHSIIFEFALLGIFWFIIQLAIINDITLVYLNIEMVHIVIFLTSIFTLLGTYIYHLFTNSVETQWLNPQIGLEGT